MGHDDAHVFLTSGMILRPDFYVEDNSDPIALRREMGLREDLPTAIVLFRRHGSKVMSTTLRKNWMPRIALQLILICGRNESWRRNCALAIGKCGVYRCFTKEVHRLMRAADFWSASPALEALRKPWFANSLFDRCNPGRSSGALQRQWVREKSVGMY